MDHIGSHACYIPKKKLYYFDSYGEKADPQILKLFKNIISQGEQMGMKFMKNTMKLDINIVVNVVCIVYILL